MPVSGIKLILALIYYSSIMYVFFFLGKPAEAKCTVCDDMYVNDV